MASVLGMLEEREAAARVRVEGLREEVLTLHYKDSAAVHPLRELDGLTGLTNLTLVGGDVSAWVAEAQGGPPALKHLQLYHCVFSPDRCALSRFGNLERVITEGCHRPDGTPVTHLDIPGVQVVI